MKYDVDYWLDAYFDGWLGKLLVVAFVGLVLYTVLK
jgi:hypothetical protein